MGLRFCHATGDRNCSRRKCQSYSMFCPCPGTMPPISAPTPKWDASGSSTPPPIPYPRDKQGLLALSAEDIEWIIPGEDWPLAGTHRGHAGLENLLQKANETVETSFPEPPEFIAQGDRVLVVGFATGRIKATNRTFEDHWVFAITVRNGKLTNVREYVDTQALARASETAASPRL